MSTILKKELNARVKGTLNGRRTSMSKLEYIAKQLVDKAMSADHRSIQQLITIQPTMFGVGHADSIEDTPLSDAEVALLDALRRRIPESDEEAGHVADPTAISDIEEPDDDA